MANMRIKSATSIKTDESNELSITARRSESHDAPGITQLITPQCDEIFGRFDVFNVIEKSILSITIADSVENIIAAAAFCDYPNVAEVDSSSWLEWYRKYYDVTNVTPINAVWMHYFASRSEYAASSLDEIIRTMFNTLSHVHYCFLAVPRGTFPEQALTDTFQMQSPLDPNVSDYRTTVFLCSRSAYIPVLHVREAMVEDQDDIAPIFNSYSTHLKEFYGDFFLAELIEAQSDDLKCLVVESGGVAVGFMSVSNEVNYDLLNQCYELDTHNGLYKFKERPKTAKPEPVPDETAGVAGEEAEQSATAATAEEKPSAGAVVSSSEGKAASTAEKKSKDETPSKKSVDSVEEAAATAVAVAKEEEKPVVEEAEGQPEVQDECVAAEEEAEEVKIPNALVVQLFCIDEANEHRSYDFLSKVFELFPDFDFLIMSTPHLVPEINLLQYFSRVPHKPQSTMNQDLYVFNKYSLMSNFYVMPSSIDETDSIRELTETMKSGDIVMSDFVNYVTRRKEEDGNQLYSFTAICSERVVGVAMISLEKHIDYIRSHFDVESFIFYNQHAIHEHGCLRHFALNPAFSYLARIFLKECMRLAHKTALYYSVFPSDQLSLDAPRASLISFLSELVPLPARRQIPYNVDDLSLNAPSDRVLQQQSSAALFHTNLKLVLEQKITINAKIVVVGASDTGLSFLETLIMCPHIKFNNLTLISTYGLNEDSLVDYREETQTWSGAYCRRYLDELAIRASVNIITGRMTAINRTRKFIFVDGDRKVYYDHLVLATGRQYYAPEPLKLLDQKEKKQYQNRLICERPPDNVVTLNSFNESDNFLTWFNAVKDSDESKQVIIYGSTLDMFVCANSLLSHGLNPKRLMVVRTNSDNLFHDAKVEEKVLGELRTVGATYHSNPLVLFDWAIDSVSGGVESLTFMNEKKKTFFVSDVLAFICFDKKSVDIPTFLALNNANLVFDGQLVIDRNFHTTDETIRAAGPLTKWKRRFYSDETNLEYWNSKEIGAELGKEMLKLFDPFYGPITEPEPPNGNNLTPLFVQPIIEAGRFPGNKTVFLLRKPGHEIAFKGRLFTTETVKNGLMRIHVNEFGHIDFIACVSDGGSLKHAYELAHFTSLYSLHERYLNNLVSRFDEGLIGDFYEYFQEKWAYAVFHDRFGDFRNELRQLLATAPLSTAQTLEDKIREYVGNDLQLSKFLRDTVWSDYSSSGVRSQIERRFIDFIQYNAYHLPMYAKAGLV